MQMTKAKLTSIRIPVRYLEDLQSVADSLTESPDERITVSDVIRIAIRQYLENNKTKTN